MSASNRPALEGFLERLLRRSSLGVAEQQAILGLSGHVEQVGPHRDIVSPGQSVTHACLVVRGLTARYDAMADGQRQLTAFHIPGDMCDLHSVACPTAAWGIVALTATSVLRIPHSELRGLAIEFPTIAIAFWRDGTADGSILAKWVGNLGRRDARARTAHLFCEVGVRMEIAGIASCDRFWFDVTQADLADALGLTPVHLNRTLQALRGDGLIESESRMICVPDWPALASIAAFDPDYLLLSCGTQGKAATAADAPIAPTTRH